MRFSEGWTEMSAIQGERIPVKTENLSDKIATHVHRIPLLANNFWVVYVVISLLAMVLMIFWQG